jgi:hypothetical protein
LIKTWIFFQFYHKNLPKIYLKNARFFGGQIRYFWFYKKVSSINSIVKRFYWRIKKYFLNNNKKKKKKFFFWHTRSEPLVSVCLGRGRTICPENLSGTWVTSDFFSIDLFCDSNSKKVVQKIFGCVYSEIISSKKIQKYEKSCQNYFFWKFHQKWWIMAIKFGKFRFKSKNSHKNRRDVPIEILRNAFDAVFQEHSESMLRYP